MEKNITRSRSPISPSRDLEDCYNLVVKVYQQYSHARFSRSEIASALDFSASSGSFNVLMSSLKGYGLIDADRDGFKISELFKNMKIADKNSNQFKKLALNAIRSSQVFNDILNEFKDKIPSSANLAQRLEVQKKFNPKNAKVTAEALEDSLRFAGLLDANNNILKVREDDEINNTERIEQEDHTVNEHTSSVKSLTLEVPLENNRVVKVFYPFDITKEEGKKISSILEAIGK